MSGIIHAWKVDDNGQASPAIIDDFDDPLK